MPPAACPSHLLVKVYAIDDITEDHSVAVDIYIGGLVEGLRVHIPKLEDVEPLLGADGDAYNLIRIFLGDDVENAGSRITDKGLVGGTFWYLNTVGSPTDVQAMLIEWWVTLLHEEEHTGEHLGFTDSLKSCPKIRERLERTNYLVGIRGPRRICWVMEIKCPGPRRK